MAEEAWAALVREGQQHFDAGAYREALGRWQEAEDLAARRLGAKSLVAADISRRIGRAYRQLGDYAKARERIERALATILAEAGPESLEAATAYHDLGSVFFRRGELNEALEQYRKALAIRERELGPTHIETALVLQDLGSVHFIQEELPVAREYLLKAIAVEERVYGSEDVRTALAYSNLGLVEHHMGHLARALELFQKAYEIYYREFGERHPIVPGIINNMAALYKDLGDSEGALRAFETSLQLKKSLFGDDHVQTGGAHVNVATMLGALGRFEEAFAHQTRAIEILTAIYGPEHPDIAKIYINRGDDWLRRDEPERAVEDLQRAYGILQKVFGEEHPHAATTLAKLGEAHSRLGHHDEAHQLFDKALAVQRKRYDEGHPLVVEVIVFKARALRREQKGREALEHFEWGLAGAHQFRARLFEALDARGRIRSSEQYQKFLWDYLQTVMTFQPPPSQLSTTYTILLRYKGAAASFQTSIGLARERADAASRELLARYLEVTRALSAAALVASMEAADTGVDEKVEELEATVSELERTLSGRLLEFQQALELHQLATEDVAAVLKEGELLIDYVVLLGDLFAFTVDAKAQVTLHPLGVAADLGPAIRSLQAALADPAKDPWEAARELYQALVAPLRERLAGHYRLLISPDGDLNTLPFELLRDDAAMLLEHGDIQYLPSARELVRLRRFPPQQSVASPPALFGDPNFTRIAAAELRSGGPGRSGLLDAEATASYREWLRGLEIPRLPGTRDEVASIRACFPEARVFLREEASEENLFRLRAPRILHLATHGYFFPGGDPVDPLLRALVALSGARASMRQGRDFGLLPALKLLGLDLRGTDLVVVSACESALGSIYAGEGVMGLTTALFAAGARGVVSSLWRVHDQATSAFMASFYDKLAAGMPTSAALRETKLEFATRWHPHHWAAFLLYGDTVALQGD